MQSPLHELAPTLEDQSLRVLVWDRDLIDMWCLDAAGERRPYRGRGSQWHCHADLELTLITRGSGILCVGDHVGRFEAPDCLLLGRNLPHVWTSREPMAGVSLQFRLDPPSALAALPEVAQLARLWMRARRGLRWHGRVAEQLRERLPALESQPALARLSSFLGILELLRARQGDARPLSQQPLVSEAADRHGEAINRVLAHLMERYQDEIRLDQVVRLSGMSQATFCRRFARATGKTFTAYLNAIRVQEVRRALLESRRSVTDIALGAGFASLTNFYAVFRRQVGCAPRAFRRRLGASGTARA